MAAVDTQFYPATRDYRAQPQSIYAQFGGPRPNRCRTYHVSADLDSAAAVADAVLPVLASQGIFHQVVRTRSLLARQSLGEQAGRFITICMDGSVTPINPLIHELGSMLRRLRREGKAQPCPRAPRPSPAHGAAERPLDDGMFIYGGVEGDAAE